LWEAFFNSWQHTFVFSHAAPSKQPFGKEMCKENSSPAEGWSRGCAAAVALQPPHGSTGGSRGFGGASSRQKMPKLVWRPGWSVCFRRALQVKS